MAFSFTQGDKSLEAGFRRIASSQIGKALDELDDRKLDLEIKIHQVRKRCKKVRALLRLVRPDFADYAEENAAFRDMARPLSGLRDASALELTHALLVERYAGEGNRRLLESIGPALTRRAEPAVEDSRADAKTDDLRAALARASDRACRWVLDQAGFSPAQHGMARIYAEGRAIAREIGRDASDEAFHDWRKRVKYHWHHTRLLREIEPEVMDAHAESAGALARLLGEHHDLGVLRARLADLHESFARADALLVTETLIERRRGEIVNEALVGAAELFREKPGAIGIRWRDFWEQWREDTQLAAS